MTRDNETETYRVTWTVKTRTSESFTSLDDALILFYALEEDRKPRIWLESKGTQLMPPPLEYWREINEKTS